MIVRLIGAATLLAGAYSQPFLDCDPRVDPGGDLSTDCVSFGCTSRTSSGEGDLAPLCYFPNGWGYVANATVSGTDFGVMLTPTAQGNIVRFPSVVGTPQADPWNVELVVSSEGPTRLRLHFQPYLQGGTKEERYEIPEEIVRLNPPSGGGSPEFNVDVQSSGTNQVFSLVVNRAAHGSTTEIFRADLPGFTLEDQFLEISMRCPTEYVYGFGEHEHHTLKHSWDYMYLPMLTTPHGVEGYNDLHIYPSLYGHHPFFMGFDADGMAYGVLFWNSNAQEVYLQPDNIMTFRSIGGLLDIRIMTGPSPAEVFAQYHAMIGTPYFPPYWALGFQLSKYYYGSRQNLTDLYERMIDANIPWDVQQLDIDYMDRQRDFTTHREDGLFDGLAAHVDRLHDDGMKFVVILDPAITSNDTVWDYDDPDCTRNTPNDPVCPLIDYTTPPSGAAVFSVAGAEDHHKKHHKKHHKHRALQEVSECCGSPDSLYRAYREMDDKDLAIRFIDDQNPGDPNRVFGKVWPDFPNSTLAICHGEDNTWDQNVDLCRGYSAWPDFGLQETADWWVEEASYFWLGGEHDGYQYGEGVKFDGIWIDMNEPENFIGGDLRYAEDEPELKCDPNLKEDNPPYRTKHPYRANAVSTPDNPAPNDKAFLARKSVCMSAAMRWGSIAGGYNTYSFYNARSLYSHSMAIPSLRAGNVATGQESGANLRSMVFSRATFAGTGALIGHWLGDNPTTWESMKRSVIGIIEFNMFGIGYVGADICGFFRIADENGPLERPFDKASPQLCYRWMQVGAFYTFSRNHATKHKTDQDPAQYGLEEGGGEAFLAAIRRALVAKYEVMPYLYTSMYEANQFGGTTLKALFEPFYQDRNTWDIEEQFMYGPGIMVSPILHEDMNEVDIYVPAGRWYDFYTHEEVDYEGRHEARTVTFVSNYTDFEGDIPLHYRGGYIIPHQHSNRTLTMSRQNPMYLVAALDLENKAAGHLHWDSGDSVIEVAGYQSLDVYFNYEDGVFSSIALGSAGYNPGLMFDSVTLLGYRDWAVDVGGSSLSSHSQDIERRLLSFHLENQPIHENFSIRFTNYYGFDAGAPPKTASAFLATSLALFVATAFALRE